MNITSRRKPTYRIAGALLALFVIIVIAGLLVWLLLRQSEHVVSPRIVGAVVSNGRGCADIGSQLLTDGGSAVDAAIGTLLCEGIILPHSMGIGGGFVAAIYTRKTRQLETVMARESAPLAARSDMFVGEASVVGGRAAAVPGEVLGYWEMHQKYGKLPWSALFQPTIKLARNGHWVSKYLAAAIKSRQNDIRANEPLAKVFLKPDGTPYVEGEYIKRLQLANTLERIARNGAAEIYGGGQTGRQLAEDIQAFGGIITEADLKAYKVSWHSAGHATANITGGYTMYTTPLPSSGPLLAFMVDVIRELYTANETVYWQRITETFKHAYGQRSNLGDVENESGQWAQLINETLGSLKDEAFIRAVRERIKDDWTTSDINYYGANFTVEPDHGTAHMSVLASNGDAVSITSTINKYFGNKQLSPQTGIIMNDEMDDFSTPGVVNSFGVPASPANYIQPGKRPMSSMDPAIVLDRHGDVRMLVGAAGGTKITTSVAITIIKYLMLNDSLEEAINGGRLHHQLVPMIVEADAQVQDNVLGYLRHVGHNVSVLPEGTGFAAVTAIGVRDGVPEPFFDRRRVGSTAVIESPGT